MEGKKETIVITGSSGLIGAELCRRLAERYTVIGFDRPGPPEPPPQAAAIGVDLASDESVREGLRELERRHGNCIASVVHLAAYYDFSGSRSPLYEKVTLRGTQRLLHGLTAFSVSQFIFSSTMLVHAPTDPGERINEGSALNPRWPYPRSKLETEQLIRGLHGDLPALLLRIAGVYDEHCHSIPLARQIQRIYEQQLTRHFYPGDPQRGQSFVHLDDTCDAICRAVDRRAELPSEMALLIGEPETLGYGEIQSIVTRILLGRESNVRRVPKPLARIGARLRTLVLPGKTFIKPWMIDRADDHYALDISRARALLGWSPRHTLRETLPRMVHHLVRDPAGWYAENGLGSPPAGAAPGRVIKPTEEAAP